MQTKNLPADPAAFGERNFGTADLGDRRRNAAIVKIANRIVQHSNSSLPAKLGNPAMLDSMYRLCRSKKVTHKAVLAPHIARTLETIDEGDEEDSVLILHDGTELDYTSKRKLAKQLGHIGNGGSSGYLVHNSLAVTSDGAVIGLTSQILHLRPKVAKNESAVSKRNRQNRESRLWCQGVANLPADWRLVDVCDRGADTFEFLDLEINSGRRFVVRSAYDRSMRLGHDPDADVAKMRLHKYARTLEPMGGTTVNVQKKTPKRKTKRRSGKLKHPPQSKRTAKLLVTAAPVMINPPQKKRGDHGDKPLPMWIVRVWEPNPPQGEEPLEWFLLTNEPTSTLEGVLQVVAWYRKRWVVEEYHKCQKTGSGIEDLQFQYRDRVEPAIALLSVTALTLLKLRDAARSKDARTRPAREFISDEYIDILSEWRHEEKRPDWSIYDFVLALGRMGGHLNRKCDGPPGWITLWRGWHELCIRVDAARRTKSHQRCAQK